MRSALTEDFQKKFGRAVGHHVRFRKMRRTVHQHQQLHNALQVVQIAEGSLQRCKQLYGYAECGLLAFSSGKVLAELADS